MGKRLHFAVMPFLWLWRGCFDWEAATVAWRLAINPTWFRRKKDKEAGDG